MKGSYNIEFCPPVPDYYNSNWSLLSQGAEARVWLIPSFITYSSNDVEPLLSSCKKIGKKAICKERFIKSYRHPDLDRRIRKLRLKAEARCLVRCRKGGVRCPAVLGVDEGALGKGISHGSACLFLEFIEGRTIRNFLNCRTKILENEQSRSPPRKKSKIESDDLSLRIAYEIGAIVGRMHNVNVVHGDLTTSNIILANETVSSINLVLIDFGLAGTAGAKGVSHEEKAVDLYVLERAFEATHPNTKALVNEIFRAYKGNCNNSDSVLQRLAQVRVRGRKRECFG